MCSQKYSTQQNRLFQSFHVFIFFVATSESIIHKLNTMKCFETPNETCSTVCSTSPTAEHQVNIRNYSRTKNVQMAKRYLCVRCSENRSYTWINTIIIVIFFFSPIDVVFRRSYLNNISIRKLRRL